jgi:hypothetical protein
LLEVSVVLFSGADPQLQMMSMAVKSNVLVFIVAECI